MLTAKIFYAIIPISKVNREKQMKILLSYKGSVQNYIDAVSGVGAEPEAEYLPKADTNYDGLILCGGGDIDPKHYNEPIDGSKNIDNERDIAELALLDAFVKAGKPVLGICRGHQLINVYFGGSLYQHMPDAELHTNKEGEDDVHNIRATSDSILAKLYGESFAVNSAHHQAIKTIGEGLRATAVWNDKYVEAIEHINLPVIGVQFHPERMSFSKAREDTVCGKEIFEYFIELCKKGKV